MFMSIDDIIKHEEKLADMEDYLSAINNTALINQHKQKSAYHRDIISLLSELRDSCYNCPFKNTEQCRCNLRVVNTIQRGE